MSLSTNISDLATRIATEVKGIRTLLNGNAADLAALSTTAKANLVAAINEVNAKTAGATINDTTASGTSVYSSNKTNAVVNAAVAALVAASPAALDTLNELAAALGDDPNFATTITSALAGKEPAIPLSNVGQYWRGDKTWQGLNKGAVGLSAVDNTSDANKPVSTATATALAGKAATVHTHTVSQISDSSAVGQSLVKAADAAAARAAIGAGTGSSNLVIGTTAGTAADAADVATKLENNRLTDQGYAAGINTQIRQDYGGHNTDFVAAFVAGLA